MPPVVIPKCGHAPQIEKARLVNQIVVRFLKDKLKTLPPPLDPARYLLKEARGVEKEKVGAIEALIRRGLEHR